MKFKIGFILLILAILFGCTKKKDDSSKTSLLVLAGLSSSAGSSSNTEMYKGFADIPASIYKTVASGSTSASIQANSRTVTTTDPTKAYLFANSKGDASVAHVYDLVKVTAKSTRDITKSIGDLVKRLEEIPVGLTTIQEDSTWGEPAVTAKFKYQPSTVISGGKKLEVWWFNGATPYTNNKAIELNYKGSTATGNISGFVFVRFLSKAGATTLSKAYIKFEYDATAQTRSMVVILQDIGNLYTDNAHFFVKEVNGVTAMDGTYTVKDFNANSSGTAIGVTAAPRAYMFSAIGNSSKAVIKAAFPQTTDTTTTDIYANTALGNIGQVWTNFILANSTLTTTINSVGGTCGSSFIMTTPNSGNPTSATGVTTVATLKTCLDAIIPLVGTTAVKDVYFLTNIKNPAYFTVSGNTVSLYGVESLAADANKIAFDTLQTNSSFLNVARNTSDTTYPASLDAVSVAALNVFTGTSVPTGTSATDLTTLNARWGDGTPGTGTSSASAGANTVNGSKDDVAPF